MPSLAHRTASSLGGLRWSMAFIAAAIVTTPGCLGVDADDDGSQAPREEAVGQACRSFPWASASKHPACFEDGAIGNRSGYVCPSGYPTQSEFAICNDGSTWRCVWRGGKRCLDWVRKGQPSGSGSSPAGPATKCIPQQLQILASSSDCVDKNGIGNSSGYVCSSEMAKYTEFSLCGGNDVWTCAAVNGKKCLDWVRFGTAGAGAGPGGGAAGSGGASAGSGGSTACTPKCAGKQCGPDGCGKVCGTCNGGQQCTSAGQCAGGAGAITAADAAASMANGFNVGNTFDVPQHPRTTGSVNAMIDAYYREGFRTVRLPVRWISSNWAGEGALAADSGQVNRNHPRLAVLQAVVDYALAKGMFVVVDAHHEDWLFDEPWSNDQATRLSRVWRDVCDIFKDRPHKLIFEILNEPHGTIRFNSAAVRSLNQRSYDAIRSCGGNNSNRIVIISGEDWGGPNSLGATWPSVTDIPGGGNDPYLMGSIHYYNPLALTHADNAGGINTAWSVGDIQVAFQKVADWAKGRLPVFVGEFGVNWDQHAHQINGNVTGWYAAVAAETRRRGWAFTVWDDGGWFRVMNRSNQQFNGLQNACVP